VNRKNAAKHC